MRTRDQLRGYQRRAVSFITKKRRYAALFIDMGLGKTVISLTAIVDLLRSGEISSVLVVAPIRVMQGVWRQEAREWQHTRGLKFSIVHGPLAKRIKALEQPAHVHIINPEGVKWLKQFYGSRKWPWDMLVVDESVMFSDPNTKRFKALRAGLRHFKRRIILTGKPTPRSLVQLWAQMFLVDRGYSLGQRFTEFKEQHFYKSGYMGYKLLPKENAEHEIVESMSPRVVRLDARDWLELPEVINNYVWVDLPPNIMTLYREFEQAMFFEWLEDLEEVEASTTAVVSQKCRQIAGGAIYTADIETGERKWRPLHDAKIEAIKEVVASLQGEPALVSYQFKHDLERLRVALPEAKVFDKNNVERIIAKWNKRMYPQLLVHPKNAAHGLNLQKGGHNIITFNPTFSYDQHSQLIGRLARSGQANSHVVNHMILARNTVDEIIVDAIEEKGETADRVNNAFKRYYDRRFNRR